MIKKQLFYIAITVVLSGCLQSPLLTALTQPATRPNNTLSSLMPPSPYDITVERYGKDYADKKQEYYRTPKGSRPIFPLPGRKSKPEDFTYKTPFMSRGNGCLHCASTAGTVTYVIKDTPYGICESGIEDFENIINPTMRQLYSISVGGESHGLMTSRAAWYVNEELAKFYRETIEEAKTRYRRTPRGGNSSLRCVDHLRESAEYFVEWMNYIKDETRKGNADLAGTGINIQESIYNK